MHNYKYSNGKKHQHYNDITRNICHKSKKISTLNNFGNQQNYHSLNTINIIRDRQTETQKDRETERQRGGGVRNKTE